MKRADGPRGARGTVTTPPSLRRAALVGVVAGLTSGLFGVGGGVVIVPGLVLFAGFGQHLAHGISLTAIVPIALAGVTGYAVAGQVDVAAAGLLAAGALVGTPIGVALLRRLSAAWLRTGFAVLLVLTAGRLVVEVGEGAGRASIDVGSAAGYAASGLVAGVVAGLMGVGGGVLIVPLLTLLFAFPLVLAKGTSLAVIVPVAVLGTVRNYQQGTTDLRAGAVVGVSGVITAAAASWLSLELDETLSAWLFAGLLWLVAVRLLLRVRSERGNGD